MFCLQAVDESSRFINNSHVNIHVLIFNIFSSWLFRATSVDNSISIILLLQCYLLLYWLKVVLLRTNTLFKLHLPIRHATLSRPRRLACQSVRCRTPSTLWKSEFAILNVQACPNLQWEGHWKWTGCGEREASVSRLTIHSSLSCTNRRARIVSLLNRVLDFQACS